MLRLPSDRSCVRFTRATVRFLPPPGAVFGVLQVTADGREAARLTGVPRAASATVRLTGARTAVRVSGTTLGGQVIGASRCLPPLRQAAPARAGRGRGRAPPTASRKPKTYHAERGW